MTIEERIKEHEIRLRKLNDRKLELEDILNKINEKIMFHSTAICNLKIKKQGKEL